MTDYIELPDDWREQTMNAWAGDASFTSVRMLIESWSVSSPEGGEPTPAKERIALLRRAAEGRREYATALPENETNPALREQRAALLAQSAALESAAKIMEGDNDPLYGLLPSWRWTDEEVLAVVVADAAVDVINSGSVGGDSTDTPLTDEQRAERERQAERARTCSYPDDSGYRCHAELGPDGFCDDATHRPSGVGEVAADLVGVNQANPEDCDACGQLDDRPCAFHLGQQQGERIAAIEPAAGEVESAGRAG